MEKNFEKLAIQNFTLVYIRIHGQNGTFRQTVDAISWYPTGPD